MYWIGTKIQNLVKQSDCLNVGSLWVFQNSSLSGSGLSGTSSRIRGPFDARKRQSSGLFITGSGESYISACDTISVNSGEQIIASGIFLDCAAIAMYAVTPHGRVGINYSTSYDVFSYFYDSTSSQAYLDESNIDPVLQRFDSWFSLKLSITARSTGNISPLNFKGSNFTGTFSEGVPSQFSGTAFQVHVNPTSRLYGVPPYQATSGTQASSDRTSGVELNAYDVLIGKRRQAGISASLGADRYSYKWGTAQEVTLRIEAEQIEDTLVINSYWAANETVIFMNTNNPTDTVSGTITNNATPISILDMRGETIPYRSFSGVIKLESF